MDSSTWTIGHSNFIPPHVFNQKVIAWQNANGFITMLIRLDSGVIAKYNPPAIEGEYIYDKQQAFTLYSEYSNYLATMQIFPSQIHTTFEPRNIEVCDKKIQRDVDLPAVIIPDDQVYCRDHDANNNNN